MYEPKSWLISIYNWLPTVFQNLAYSAIGYLNKRSRFGKEYYHRVEEFNVTQWYGREDIEKFQRRALRKIFTTARSHVDFYKDAKYDKIDESNISPLEILHCLPVINKAIVISSNKSIVNSSIKDKKLLVNLTSGTSGQPLKVFHTKKSFAAQWAIWARHKYRFGIKQLGPKFLTFGARVPVSLEQRRPPYWRHNWSMNQVYLSIYHLGEQQLPAVVKFLQKTKFKYYTGYPSAMKVVAEYVLEGKIEIHDPPEMIFTGSDALSKSTQDLIERAFKTKVSEQYGMAESCGNFSKCEKGNFHLDFEFGYVEYLDIEDDPSSEFKRMVFTGFTNDAMPLIRYDVGDLCIPTNEKCECGRQSEIIKALVGRQEDYILTKDRRKIQGMNQVFEWSLNTKEMQIVQQTDLSLLIKYVPTVDFNITSDLDGFKTELLRRIGEDMQLKFEAVPFIQRAKNGKYKAVVSLTDESKSLPEKMASE